MDEIKAFKVTNLPNDTHLTYNLMVVNMANQCEAIQDQFGQILHAYAVAVEQEDNYMHQMQGSDITGQIEKEDKERDRLYYILDHMVDVYLHFDASPRRKAAEKIDTYLKRNRVDVRAQYDRETGMILNLVQDLTTYCEAELRQLELWDNVQLLQQANDRLFQLIQDRIDQEAGRVPNAVADARKVTDRLYHALVNAVNAMALVAPEGFANFIVTMNLNIDRLNASVFRKSTSTTTGGLPATGDGDQGDQEGDQTEGDGSDGDQGDGGQEVIIITPEQNE